MYFKRKVHCLVAFIISAFLCVTVLSACKQTAEVQAEETASTSTTTMVSETTTQTTMEETTTVSKIEEKTEQTTTADTIKTEETTIITTKPAETVATAAKTETTVAPTETSAAVSNPQTATPISYEAHTEMPEIVFIEFDSSYCSENVAYGYFINNKGEIRYFEFFDEKAQDYEEEMNKKGYPYWSYSDNYRKTSFSKNLLTEKYNMIIDISVDTGERVEESKLVGLYDQLLSVNKNSRIKKFSPVDDMPVNTFHTYGIRKTKYEISIDEILMLVGSGSVEFSRDDKNVQPLLQEVSVYFPPIDEEYVPKLLQNEDEQQED